MDVSSSRSTRISATAPLGSAPDCRSQSDNLAAVTGTPPGGTDTAEMRYRPSDFSRIARNSFPSRHSGIFDAFPMR